MNRRLHGWMKGLMDEWMGGWDRWMNRCLG